MTKNTIVEYDIKDFRHCISFLRYRSTRWLLMSITRWSWNPNLAVFVIPLTSQWEDKGSSSHYAMSVGSGHRRCRGQMGILSDKSCWLQHAGTRDQILPQELIWPMCTSKDILRNVFLFLQRHKSCLDSVVMFSFKST